MAFPSTKTKEGLSLVFGRVQRDAASLRGGASALRNRITADTVNATHVLALAASIGNLIAAFNAAATTPGLEAYAREQINDPTLNIAAEFNTMVSAAQACLNWIIANFPKDGSGYLLAATMDANGQTVYRSFPASSLGGLATALDTLIAAIA